MGDTATFRDVVKRFGRVDAVRRLNLTVGPGTTALLGRNGAGKSTVMNLLTGVVRPDSGEVRIHGALAGSVAAVGGVSRQLEFPGTAASLTTSRIARLLVMDSDEENRLYEHLAALEVPDDSLAKMSRGNQVKFALAVAFARERDLLLLDEPTSGLDAMSVGVLMRMVDERRRLGKSTLVATHQPTLTPHMFDRVVVIDLGQLHYEGTLEDLVQQGQHAEQSTPVGQFSSALSALARSPMGPEEER